MEGGGEERGGVMWRGKGRIGISHSHIGEQELAQGLYGAGMLKY